MTAIDDLIKGIETLKPIPQISTQIMALAQNPESSMTEIADLITYDPSLTANLLKMCNSAYFGLSRQIDSVHDAITLLGLDQIIELVVLKGVGQNLKKEQEGYGLQEGELWRHAVSSAIIARELAEEKGLIREKHLIFTAALLKDIGKVLLSRFVAFSYEKINILVQSKGYSFREAEKEVIGLDHAELGGIIAGKWHFSDKLISIIQNHHLTDEKAGQDRATAIVYLSDIICMMLGVGAGSDGLAYRFYGDVLKKLEMSLDDVKKIMIRFKEDADKIQRLLEIV